MHGNGADRRRQGGRWSGRGIRGAADRGQLIARDVRDQFGNQIRLGREITIDGAGRDIGANRNRRDLHGGHAGFGRGIARRRQNSAAPCGQALHHLMGSPIDHGAFLVPSRGPAAWRRPNATSLF